MHLLRDLISNIAAFSSQNEAVMRNAQILSQGNNYRVPKNATIKPVLIPTSQEAVDFMSNSTEKSEFNMQIGEINAEWIEFNGNPPNDIVTLFMHGGAYFLGKRAK
jgi:acetyl esterase/lipase